MRHRGRFVGHVDVFDKGQVMEQDRLTLRLSDHQGVDRLNSVDQFLRQSESEAILIDVSEHDTIPTPLLQTLLCAAHHWSQRDLSFSIIGMSDALKENFELLGANIDQFIKQEAAE